MSEKNAMNDLIQVYLENVTKISYSDGIPEFEVRFTGNGKKPISKIDQNNVIQKLLSSGFKSSVSNAYMLRMQNEFINKETGKTYLSNIRAQINGIHDIQKYCKNNNMEGIMVDFIQKSKVFVDEKPIMPVFKNDYNIKIDYKNEKTISSHSSFAKNILDNWVESKKSFRYINRSSFVHDKYPILVDISIIKESDRNFVNGRKRDYKLNYTFQEAEILNQRETYEIELEVINSQVGIGKEFESVDQVNNALKHVIKLILCGLQNTNYPITINEMEKVGNKYLQLVFPKKNDHEDKKFINRYFIGPGSVTLQLINLQPPTEEIIVPSIIQNYTVTDKADGQRKLLFIDSSGKIYFIDMNMNIQFTGARSMEESYFNTLIDGEHILHNKHGIFINLYAAFDIYFYKKTNVRNNPFVPNPSETSKEKSLDKFRLAQLMDVVTNLDIQSIVKGQSSPLRVEVKKFKQTSQTQSIFQCCNTILEKETKNQFEYNTDGLIFTPAYLPVGANSEDQESLLKKHTWEHSFKWKPPKFNTIDFLINTQKNETGIDEVKNKYQNGTDTTSFNQFHQYKTIILKVGFNESEHGYINPCADVINDKLPIYSSEKDNDRKFKPLPFYPSDPSDDQASVCNIMLNSDGKMVSEEGEVFEDNMIVEFSYDPTKPVHWRWSPLRVRYDKTEEFKKGLPQFGNAYHVANNNWYSIHHPISNEIISSGENIPEILPDDDVYYNRSEGSANLTQALRSFHNLYVKKKLIKSVSKRGDTLIDYAVGMGGDFTKWIEAKIGFVFGMDISKDNIENKIKGACARYLNYRKKFEIMPSALFVQGNAVLNIKNGKALYSEKSKQIVNAIFGEGPKDRSLLGEGVYKHYGKVADGFQISSIQFAIHYFFENKFTLHEFLRNISECTKVNGYVVGTCFDGKRMFDFLQSSNKGDTKSIFRGKNKLWSVTKQYEQDEFLADYTCLGYTIDVFQESINQTLREYLVNFDYMIQLMEDYGFSLVNSEEVKDLGLPSSYGSFKQLYSFMENELRRFPQNKKNYGNAYEMTPEEKQISYFNNYFVFKKVRSINAKYIYDSFVGQIESTKETSGDDVSIEPVIIKSKKLKKKLTLKGGAK